MNEDPLVLMGSWTPSTKTMVMAYGDYKEQHGFYGWNNYQS
jgi:hypothetical protein